MSQSQNHHDIDITNDHLEDIVRSAHENLKKLQQLSLLPTENNLTLQSKPTRKSPKIPGSENIRKMNSSSSSTHLVRSNSVPKNITKNKMDENNLEIVRKVDFLFKKVKDLDQQMSGMKNELIGIKNGTKESHNLSVHLSDIVKMDKHSIVELREQMNGIKQKLERLSQQEMLRGKYSETAIITPDVGLLSEQIFSRVHKEFTKVVDEVVRACVTEQVEFMKKWSAKSTEDEDSEVRTQLTSLKRRQNQFDERLLELKDLSDQSTNAIQNFKESLRTNSSDVHTLLETMTKRVNESLSSSNLSLRNEMNLKFDSLSHQWTQENIGLSNRIEFLQQQTQETSSHYKSLNKEITQLASGFDTLSADMQGLQQQANQSDNDLLELHEVMKEVTQYLTENKKVTQSLENSVQELNPQPVIDSLYNRIRENNEKIQQFEDLLQAYNQEMQRLQEQSWENSIKTPSRGFIQNPQQISSRQNDGIDEILMKHEDKLQEISTILEEQHTDYQETISKLSNSNRKLKLKVKELVDKMGPLGDIKGSIDQILTDILQGTQDDKHVINALKEENTQLITEVLSLKIICENMEEKYQELRRSQPSQPRNLLQTKEENAQQLHIARLEEKIETLELLVQSLSTKKESKKSSEELDRPMGISEIHHLDSKIESVSIHEQPKIERLSSGHRRGIPSVVHEDDTVSLISDTWHGTLQTHESKPYLQSTNIKFDSMSTSNHDTKPSNTIPQSSLPNLRKSTYNHRHHESKSPINHTARLPSDLADSQKSPPKEHKEVDFETGKWKEISLSPHQRSGGTTSSPKLSSTPTAQKNKELYAALHQKKLHHRKCFQSQMQIPFQNSVK